MHEKNKRSPYNGVISVGSKSGSVAVRVGLVLFSLLFLFLISRSNVEIGFGQTGLPNLKVTNVTLKTLNNVAIFSVDAPGDTINIFADIANTGTGVAQGFDVQFLARREEDQNFGSTSYCQFNTSGGGCTNLTLQAGSSVTLFGAFATKDLQAGRYIIRVVIIPKTVAQTTVDDDILETILLIGVSSPEIHPISLTFNPPSPAPQGSLVTVRVEIENTGKPENPALQVKFEYCLETATCADADFRSNGFSEGVNGVKTVSSQETTGLSLAQSIVVTNVLDTSGLAPGRYLFKVTVIPIGVTELDPNNDDISTRFSIGSSATLNAKCQISGEITTLGTGTGTSQIDNDGTRSVTMLYVASKETDGDIKVHAIQQDKLEDAVSTDPCPEIEGSPNSINGSNGTVNISTFTVDQKTRLLYVGLSNGVLWVFDVDQADRLSSASKQLTGKSLLSFSARQASSTSGQVFVGTDSSLLKRVTVTRSSSGISFSSDATCVTLSTGAVNNVQVFQGRTYFTSGSSLQRIDETSCDSRSLATVFSASSAIASMAIGNVVYPSFSSTRIVLGLENGNVHILSSSGNNITNSPVNVGSKITALAINDGTKAVATQRESVFVGTVDGKIEAIQLRSPSLCETQFQTQTKQQINVLGVYRPSTGSTVTGWVFAGSEDQRLYVVDDNCGMVQNALTTQGAVRANMLVHETQGSFGPEGVQVLYGGGSGLYETVFPLP
ncbi:hypothetical protein HY229_00125 [Candidatus Acetothermia bacterium]|nr:hypothetical protein [Candidatus Acetothermia bacterium]MBI3642502.1 hypothetical protein [Candidatus Acetothermia bacterium]